MRMVLALATSWVLVGCTSEGGGATATPATSAPSAATSAPAASATTPSAATSAPATAAAPTEPESAAAPFSATPELMRDVRRLLKRGDPEALAQTVSFEGTVVAKIEHSLGEGRPDRTTLRGREEFARWLRGMAAKWGPPCRSDPPADSCEWMNGLHILSRIACEGDCCSHSHEGLSHNTLFLDRICFEATAGGPPRIRSMDFTDGD